MPSLRATGQKVWSRIRRQERQDQPRLSTAAADAKLRALRIEVERVALARSQRERTAQLARVFAAVSDLAAAHGLSQSELDALRAGRTGAVPGIKDIQRELRQRATGVVTQVWNLGMPLAARGQKALGLTPSAIASTLLKRELKRAPRAFRSVTRQRWVRSPFVLRVGRPGPSKAHEPQLIAASLLHLPRLQRQMAALRRSADAAISSAKLVRLPASEHVVAASELLRSGRSGLQLTYEVASAGAQLFLRSYVFPRVLRYLTTGLSTGVAIREVATARVLPPSR